MRRVIGDAAISVAALVLLLLMLVSVDERVREQVTGYVSGAPNPSTLVTAGRHIGDVVTVVLDAAREQSVANAPLMIFALAATVLVLFMVRT
jgi:hypothetical protein